MSKWRDALRYAFAVEKAEEFEPTEPQAAVAEKICRWVVRRRLTTAAQITLEAHRGLNYIGSQVMHFFRPAVDALTDARGYTHFAEFMEHRGSIDWLCRRINELEEEHDSKQEDRGVKERDEQDQS